MALDTYVEVASSEQLESSLRYLVPKTSSAIVSSRAATVFSAGGDSYSPANGVRAITFRIQGSGGAAAAVLLGKTWARVRRRRGKLLRVMMIRPLLRHINWYVTLE